MDSIDKLGDVEIDEQASSPVPKPQVGEQFLLINRCHFGLGLVVNDDYLFDNQVLRPWPAIYSACPADVRKPDIVLNMYFRPR